MRSRVQLVEANNKISVSRQCELLGLSRASYYYKPIPETEFNLLLMREIDKQYMNKPAFGSRLMTAHLRKIGHKINRKRVVSLMRKMGIVAVYPKPKRQGWQKNENKFPYLLKDIKISSHNHVWGIDITYIPVENGFLYLVAVVDLFTRFVLSWKLSDSLETDFCIEALKEAFKQGKPKIMHSDQGVQFTSREYIALLQENEITISMSGKGRCYDNIFVERFWRTLKYEEVYLKQYGCFEEALEGIGKYIDMYNYERPHSSLDYDTPWEWYNVA